MVALADEFLSNYLADIKPGRMKKHLDRKLVRQFRTMYDIIFH
jgi:hypothetical protein